MAQQTEFIPYEQALELKELGFEEPCFGAWAENELFIPEKQNPSVQSLSNNQCLSPLYQQAFRFFREKYGYSGIVEGSKKDGYEWCIYPDEDFYVKNPNNSNTYEEAEHECLW